MQPDWPAVPGVQALFTTRAGGVSEAPFNTMNLGDHVRDKPEHVAANRQVLRDVVSQLSPGLVEPVFMQQVHGCDVQDLRQDAEHGQAFDACVTNATGVACTIMVADCLPVLWAHRSGYVVAAAHAGWRGLLGEHGVGVLETTWQAYGQQLEGLGQASSHVLAEQTQVWLGPCIGPQAFEVGDEVRTAFVQSNPDSQAFFAPLPDASGKWLANLPGLARQRLQALGVTQIYGNDGSPAWCTVTNTSLFFSHRRDAAVLGSTGRMAACIWKV